MKIFKALATLILITVYQCGLAHSQPNASPAPILLTVSGLISSFNRGPSNQDIDQLMGKQGIGFNKAFTFDFGDINALPAVEISPTLEYDGKLHKLKGPLLIDVLRAAGISPDGNKLLLKSFDGYQAIVDLADIIKYRYIVATHLDGKVIPLGGLGPLWAVYDANRFPEVMRESMAERYKSTVWGLFYIEVMR